ncbi:MAG: cytochrome P460 family protein, partial [Planctomycetes bacterium]|nr:cytochrome P460 family protein [Planctomycetota bacterium]
RELGEDVDVQYEAYSPGTILVKSHFLDKIIVKPKKVTFMIKEKRHYDIQYDNWRYVMFDGGRKVLDGNSQSNAVYTQCISCHQSVRNRGFTYNNYLHDILRIDGGAE